MRFDSPALVYRRHALQAERSYALSHLDVLRDIRGDPLNAAQRRFGKAVAISVQRSSNISLNRVIGFGDLQIEHLDEILKWYSYRGCEPCFELPHWVTSEQTINVLRDRGFVQMAQQQSLLIRTRSVLASKASAIRVDYIGINDIELFAETYANGWQFDLSPVFCDIVRGWFAQPNTRLYLAFVDGQAVGAAILFILKNYGYLADAAVSPLYRGYGVHNALIGRRCSDAISNGAKQVSSEARSDSVSERNLGDNGFDLIGRKYVWIGRAIELETRRPLPLS